jgi:hypothetical protein
MLPASILFITGPAYTKRVYNIRKILFRVAIGVYYLSGDSPMQLLEFARSSNTSQARHTINHLVVITVSKDFKSQGIVMQPGFAHNPFLADALFTDSLGAIYHLRGNNYGIKQRVTPNDSKSSSCVQIQK